MTSFIQFSPILSLAFLLSFNAGAQLKAQSEKKLLAELTAIVDTAAVANGGAGLEPYSPKDFDLNKALASLAEERPEVIDFDDNSVKQTFKTTVGTDKAIAVLKSEDFSSMTEDDGVGRALEKLNERGLIREIL